MLQPEISPQPPTARDLLLLLVGKIEGQMSSLFSSLDAFSQQIEPLEKSNDCPASRAIYHSLSEMLKRDDCLETFPTHLRARIQKLDNDNTS